MKTGTAPKLRLIEGGKTEQGTALPETIELARALARLHFAAMMQTRKADSP